MLNRAFFIVGVFAVAVGMSGLAFAADRGTQVVYTGGHDPARITRTDPRPAPAAPYALTGSEKTAAQIRYQEIRVGSRIVGFQRLAK